MGMDHEVYFGTQAVGAGVDALLAGGLDSSLPGDVRDVHQYQLLRVQGLIGQTAGGDEKLSIRHPGADVAPGTLDEALSGQLGRRVQDLFPDPGFRGGHGWTSRGPQPANTRSKRERTSSIISSV